MEAVAIVCRVRKVPAIGKRDPFAVRAKIDNPEIIGAREDFRSRHRVRKREANA